MELLGTGTVHCCDPDFTAATQLGHKVVVVVVVGGVLTKTEQSIIGSDV